jgi:hypothetical protein
VILILCSFKTRKAKKNISSYVLRNINRNVGGGGVTGILDEKTPGILDVEKCWEFRVNNRNGEGK